MRIEVPQKIDWRLVCEFDAALCRLHTERAIRARPAVGLMLMAVAVAWMMSHTSGTATTIVVAFVFFWGMQLALVAAFKRIRSVFSMWRVLPVGRTMLIRLDSHGFGMSADGALLQVGHWNQVRRAHFDDLGVLVTGSEVAPLFVSGRNLGMAQMIELKTYLQQQWPALLNPPDAPT